MHFHNYIIVNKSDSKLLYGHIIIHLIGRYYTILDSK